MAGDRPCGLCAGTKRIKRLDGFGQPQPFDYPCPECSNANAPLARLRSWWQERQARRRQSTFIYCPSCRFELVWGGEWLGQEVETMFEAYRCNQCGTLSTWDFDTYPVPVRVEDR